ncbi:MAG: T9SS type A sorting domain-containing protein [Bacteroidia bacterium]|nr:T9SS type A sorting domain-containing protein [Bacteroidia bacterium]
MKRWFIGITLFYFGFSLAQREVRVEGAYFPIFSQQDIDFTSKTTTDTINLPFVDDFSYYTSKPTSQLWRGSSVQVNLGYGIQPPSFGVVTFNGCDRAGKPYSSTVSYGSADTLLSKPINLGGLTPSDNVFLSFFYQPQGLGDAPELKDSLIVEFKNSVNQWKQQWVKKGSSLAAGQGFRFVSLPIAEPQFLYNGFQFRFRNFASLHGDYDHWHVDYIYLNKNRNAQDSILNDISVQYPITQHSFYPYSNLTLKEYQTRQKIDSTTFYIRNLSNSTIIPLCPGRRISRYNLPIYTEVPPCLPSGLAPLITDKQSLTPFINYSLDSLNKPTHFKETFFLNQTTPDFIPANDSLQIIREVSDYISYDDGSAESGYGISGPNQGNYAFAYKYVLNASDSIKAVRIAFSRHWGIDNSTLAFKIRIWSSLIPEVLLYESPFSLFPNYNTFWVEYPLKSVSNKDTAIALPSNGIIYVGIKQTNGTPLGVASDMNTDVNKNPADYRFWVNLTGTWEHSTWKGAILFRPVMSSGPVATYIPQKPLYFNTMKVDLFPNPAQQTLYINVEGSTYPFLFTILDTSGRIVHSGVSMNYQAISLPNLSNGTYIVQILHHNQQRTQHPLIIAAP